jgi:hypothetical protein
MHPGGLADLAESQASGAGSLEAFSPRLASLLMGIASALKLRLRLLHVGTGFSLRIVRHCCAAYSANPDTFRPMTEPFIRPIADEARVLIVFEGRPLEHYAIMLQLHVEGSWQTIRLLDNAHGDHDMHRYTGTEKQPAERFAEGPVNEVAPQAINYLVRHWKAIAESWRS